NAKVLYFDIDFRNVDAVPGGGGSYRFFLGHGAITSLAVEFCANSDTFVVRDGDHFDTIRKLQTGVWHNVELALDLEAKNYSGHTAVAAQKKNADVTYKLASLDKSAAELRKQKYEAAKRPLYAVAYALTEGKPSNARVQLRGDPAKAGDEVPRGFLTILGGDTL